MDWYSDGPSVWVGAVACMQDYGRKVLRRVAHPVFPRSGSAGMLMVQPALLKRVIAHGAAH